MMSILMLLGKTRHMKFFEKLFSALPVPRCALSTCRMAEHLDGSLESPDSAKGENSQHVGSSGRTSQAWPVPGSPPGNLEGSLVPGGEPHPQSTQPGSLHFQVPRHCWSQSTTENHRKRCISLMMPRLFSPWQGWQLLQEAFQHAHLTTQGLCFHHYLRLFTATCSEWSRC